MRLIDADAVKAFIRANGVVYANTLDTFPTFDPVRRGSWVRYRVAHYKCSACGESVGGITFHYCPSCGALMDEQLVEESSVNEEYMDAIRADSLKYMHYDEDGHIIEKDRWD